jgi:hypothetical protein
MTEGALQPDHMLDRSADQMLNQLAVLGSGLEDQWGCGTIGGYPEQHGVDLFPGGMGAGTDHASTGVDRARPADPGSQPGALRQPHPPTDQAQP